MSIIVKYMMTNIKLDQYTEQKFFSSTMLSMIELDYLLYTQTDTLTCYLY